MQIKGDECEEDVLPPDNVFEDILAVDTNLEDNWDLRDILRSCAIGVQSRLRGTFSIIQENCRFYGLKLTVHAEGVFSTLLLGA